MLHSILFFLLFPLLAWNDEWTLDHAIVSIYAVDTRTGEVLLEKNSDLSVTPASCMKIVTTGAALNLLGPNTRFQTHLEYDGQIDEEHVLHGNIYIRGGGDPCLGSDRIAGSRGTSSGGPSYSSWQSQIDRWVEAVQSLGIQAIAGEILGDDSKWERALAVPSWLWEDLGNAYGSGASALSFHENTYSLSFAPGKKVGEKTTLLAIEPPLPRLELHNELTTGEEGTGDRACIYGSEFSWGQAIRGTIPAGAAKFTIQGSIPDPALVASDLLQTELPKRGIAVFHQKIVPQQRVAIHTTESPTIADIVHWTNQKSINLYAEHLCKKMGEMVLQEGSSQAGVKAVTQFWDSRGLDLAGFQMADGSGLSRKNLVTTKQLVQILLKMKQSPFFPIFFDSLPQRSGSIRAKSGTMSLVKGMAGYAGEIAFAMIVNHCPNMSAMNEKIDRLFKKLEQEREMKTLPDISSISHNYPGILLDAYGVFWGGNAIGPIPGAKEMMAKLVSEGKIVGILSNATQRAANEIKKVEAQGLILGKHFHFYLTSGEVARHFLLHERLPFPTPRNQFCLFGKPHPKYASHQAIFHETVYREISDLAEADFVYLSVPHIDGQDQEDPEVFRQALQELRCHNLPMVCLNPDEFAQEGNPVRLVVRQGSLAKMYEEMGGVVFYVGKPHPRVYQDAMRHFTHYNIFQPTDILMVGDTPSTDIRGARKFGMHTALVLDTGLMAKKDHRETVQMLADTDKPDYLIGRFGHDVHSSP